MLFDADTHARPPSLNPLDGGDTARDVDNLVVDLLAASTRAFWGPRTDDVLRAACLTLRAQSGVATPDRPAACCSDDSRVPDPA